MPETFQALTDEQITLYARQFTLTEECGGLMKLVLPNPTDSYNEERMYFCMNEGIPDTEPAFGVYDNQGECRQPKPKEIQLFLRVAITMIHEPLLFETLRKTGMVMLADKKSELQMASDQINLIMRDLNAIPPIKIPHLE